MVAWPFSLTLAEYRGDQHYHKGERWLVRGTNLAYLDKDISFARLYLQEYFPRLGKVAFFQNDGE